MTIRGCLVQHMTCVRTLGALKKEERRKKKTKMTKLDFNGFQVRHFSDNFEQSRDHCEDGATPEGRSNVFRRTKFTTR